MTGQYKIHEQTIVGTNISENNGTNPATVKIPINRMVLRRTVTKINDDSTPLDGSTYVPASSNDGNKKIKKIQSITL